MHNRRMRINSNVRLSFFILTLIFLASGLVAVSVGAYFWTTPYARRRVVVTQDILIAGLVVGVITIVSAIIGLYGSIYPVRRKIWLVIYSWLVVVVLVIELSLGAIIWFRSLDIRASFSEKWRSWDPALRSLFQETDSCCGYFDSTDYPAVSFSCKNNDTGPGASWPGCVDMIHIYMDNYLRNIYTALFGFVAVDVFALIAAVVLIQARNDQERYERISVRMSKLYLAYFPPAP